MKIDLAFEYEAPAVPPRAPRAARTTTKSQPAAEVAPVEVREMSPEERAEARRRQEQRVAERNAAAYDPEWAALLQATIARGDVVLAFGREVVTPVKDRPALELATDLAIR